MIDDMLVQARFDDLDRVLDKIYEGRKAKAILARGQAISEKQGLLSWLGITPAATPSVERMEPVPVRVRYDN